MSWGFKDHDLWRWPSRSAAAGTPDAVDRPCPHWHTRKPSAQNEGGRDLGPRPFLVDAVQAHKARLGDHAQPFFISGDALAKCMAILRQHGDFPARCPTGRTRQTKPTTIHPHPQTKRGRASTTQKHPAQASTTQELMDLYKRHCLLPGPIFNHHQRHFHFWSWLNRTCPCCIHWA